MILTLKSLIDKGAPRDTVRAFRKALGSSKEMSEALLLSVAENVDWGWLAANYLTPESQLAYHRERAKAFRDYQDVASPAEKEYIRLTSWPFDKFEHITMAAHQAYQAALAPLYAEFRNATTRAHAEFLDISTRAFAKHNRDLLPAQMTHKRAAAQGHARLDTGAVVQADQILYEAQMKALAEYEQTTTAAYDRYAHVRARSEAAYGEARYRLREAYHAETAKAYADLRPVILSTDKQYKRVTSDAHTKYQMARASAFAKLFLSQV